VYWFISIKSIVVYHLHSAVLVILSWDDTMVGLSHDTAALKMAVVDHGEDCLFIAAKCDLLLCQLSALINFPLISAVINKTLGHT
jgi:hypothetical protein